MQARLSVLTPGELEQIHAATRRVLAEKGIRFTLAECLDVFRRAGFQITRESAVKISSDQLESALRTAPGHFVRHGATPARDVTIGDGVTKFAVGSLPIWVAENSFPPVRRPATLADLRNFTLLSEALDGFEIGNPVVQPQEVPVGVMHALWNRTVSVRMTKPACCWYATTSEMAAEGLEILRLAAGGLDELRRSRRWAITICPDSAMQWGKSAIGVLAFAPAEVPIEVLPMPFLGSMHPVTMPGALVQATAETLAIVVLAQIVRSGAPVVFAPSYGGVMDMSAGTHAFGAPESALFAAAAAEVGRGFGLPTDMMQGTTDSKRPDAQAAWEKTLALALPALAGADCITQAGALLDSALSASYEEIVIDEEIVGNVRRIAGPCEVNAETLAIEEILRLPFGGHYLESEHTLRHFRKELFRPALADRRNWQHWAEEGGTDASQRAGARAAELLSSMRPVSGLPPDRARAVDDFVAGIFRRHGVHPETLLD